MASGKLTDSSINWLQRASVQPVTQHEDFRDEFLTRNLGQPHATPTPRQPVVEEAHISNEQTNYSQKALPGENAKGARVEESVMQKEMEKWMSENASTGIHWHPYARREFVDIEAYPDIVVADSQLREAAKKEKEDSIAIEEVLGFIDVKKNLHDQQSFRDGIKQIARWGAKVLRVQKVLSRIPNPPRPSSFP